MEPQRYQSLVYDSARWEGFVFRPDDIVISTPPKCGTTWTQMICALLVFQTTTFGQTLDRISPWLDMLTRELASVRADLDAQTHRRFIKSHTPFDGPPRDPNVTYICVGRDPRECAAHMLKDRLGRRRAAVAGVGERCLEEASVTAGSEVLTKGEERPENAIAR